MTSPVVPLIDTFATNLEAITGLYDDGSGITKFRRLEVLPPGGGAGQHRKFDFEPPRNPAWKRSMGSALTVVGYDLRLYLYLHQGNRTGMRFTQGVIDDLAKIKRWWVAQTESGWGVAGVSNVIMKPAVAELAKHRYLFLFEVEAEEDD